MVLHRPVELAALIGNSPSTPYAVSHRAAEVSPVYNAAAMTLSRTARLLLALVSGVAFGADSYYRVQVGPYSDTQSAANAGQDLEANGFKFIVNC